MFCCVRIPATRTGAYWGMVSFCIVLGIIGAALFITGSVVVSKSGDPVKGYVMTGIGFVVGAVAVGTLAYVEQERTRRFIIQQAAAAANGSTTTTAAIPIPNSSSRDAPPSAAAIDVTDSMTPVMGTAIHSQPQPQSYAPNVVMLQQRPQAYAVVSPPRPIVLMAQPQTAVVVTRPLYQPYPPTHYVVTSQPAMATAVYVQQPQPTTMVYTTVRQF